MVHPVIAIKYQHRFADDFGSFRIHFAYRDDTVESCTASGPRMNQIDLPVFIPQRRRVYHAFSGLYQYRFIPFTLRVFGLHHKNAEIRISPINIELTVMVTYGRSPHALSMLRLVIEFFRFDSFQRVVYQFPIHQILGMENGQPRSTIKAGSGHIKIISHRTHIRIGIVGMQNRIHIRPILPVGNPNFGNGLSTYSLTKCKYSKQYKKHLYHNNTFFE